jgi:hypothetical protein
MSQIGTDSETIWSALYPGNQHTVHCLQPAVLAAENALELAPAQRKRTVWRLDGGAGSDEHIRWLLDRDYHLVAKGMSTQLPKNKKRGLKQRLRL